MYICITEEDQKRITQFQIELLKDPEFKHIVDVLNANTVVQVPRPPTPFYKKQSTVLLIGVLIAGATTIFATFKLLQRFI